jgi:putative ABC transport system substrate-binding protein
MAELGYVEGSNFTYDHVQIPNVEAWESAYRDVVARKPDIVLAAGPELSLKSALATTGNLPVVMIAVDFDPITRGYITSLARPTGTVTGLYFRSTEIVGKRLEMLKDAFPDITTMIVFWDQASADHWTALHAVAPQFGIKLSGVEFSKRPYDYEKALAGVAPGSREFLFAVGSPFFFLDRDQLAQAVNRHGVISMVNSREAITAGGLMSYGPSTSGLFALSASYVDRLAKGAKPADLPIEQPTKFELVVNLKTAKAIGAAVPPTLLARADEVIE